jgi:hypothetical protein
MHPNSRHEQNCKICNHPNRDEIEQDFCEWKSVVAISREYKLNRVPLYRHARAVGLFARRDKNIKAALGRLIERGYRVRVTAAAVISAIKPTQKSTLRASGSIKPRT